MLGTSDTWSMSRSLQTPSNPVYHIEDCRISNPFFNFLASRWSDDEFVVGKEGEIYQQGSLFGDFFQRMFGGRRERYESDQFPSIEPFLNHLVEKILTSNLKANVNVSLSGAWLAGLVATDSKSVINKISMGEPQDVNFDLIVKIEDFTVKVIQN